MNKKVNGFTLIEVMIVVAIVGILAAVAIPSYLDSLRKSRRSDATTSLTRIQLAQETYRLNHATYGNITDLGIGTSSSDGYYTLNITGNNATAYTATATAVSGKSQASDTTVCRTLTLTVTNGGNTVGNTDASCWSK